MACKSFLSGVFFAVLIFSVLVFGGEEKSSKTVKAKTLIVVEDLSIQQSHSQFFDALRGLGQEITFFKADDPSLSLLDKGSIAYDNLVLFAPSVEAFGGDLDVPGIVEFIDSGRNALVALSPTVSDSMRELALECGVEFEDQHTQVIDHFNYDASDEDGDHTLITTKNLIDNDIILDGKISKPVVFSGIAHTLKKSNDFVVPVLSASETAYSHSPDEDVVDVPRATGKNVVLASILQARNNARVFLVGSIDMFSNKHFSDDKYANADFCIGVTGWTFNARGILRFHSFDFARPTDTEKPQVITINEDIKCSVVIEEKSEDGEWKPYLADDVPIEWVMLDPYIRAYMKHDQNGLYSHEFKAPDVYGVFKYRMKYRKLGYTFLDMEEVLPVRPYRHTEYERFIPAAFPYYASAFSMLIGFILLSLVYLYSKN